MRCWAKNVSKCWQKPWQSLTLWSISSPRWKCHAKIRRTYYSLELVYPFHHFTINIITKVVIIIVTVPWIKWMISNHVKPLYMYKARREKQRENFKGWWSWMSSVRIQAKKYIFTCLGIVHSLAIKTWYMYSERQWHDMKNGQYPLQ